MATTVKVNTYAYATTHVATNLIRSLKQLVVGCGLNASRLAGSWQTLERGVAAWLRSRHLERLILEIYDPTTDRLAKRFDFDIDYSYHPAGNGDLWLDADTVAYALAKAGTVPSRCSYRIVADTRQGAPDVDGWTSTALRSTDHLRRRSVGASVGGGDLGASLNYWK